MNQHKLYEAKRKNQAYDTYQGLQAIVWDKGGPTPTDNFKLYNSWFPSPETQKFFKSAMHNTRWKNTKITGIENMKKAFNDRTTLTPGQIYKQDYIDEDKKNCAQTQDDNNERILYMALFVFAIIMVLNIL